MAKDYLQVPHVRTTFPNITTGKIEGKGLFDEVMHTVSQHLREEFDSNRIRSAEYAKVYLGSMDAVLSNTVQYLTAMALTAQQNAKIALETETLRQRLALIPHEIKQAEASVKKIEADIRHTEAQILLSQEQVKQTQAQVELTKTQREKLLLEMQLVPLQKDQILAETSRIHADIDRIRYEYQHLMPLQKTRLLIENTRIEAETRRITYEVDHLLPLEKTKVEMQNRKITSEIRLTDTQVDTAIWQRSNTLPAELSKIHAETQLITKKGVTEQRQPYALDKQIQLYDQQIWGFQRDAEHKAAKVLADTWSVQKTADDGVHVPPGLQNGEIHRAMMKMLYGVGA